MRLTRKQFHEQVYFYTLILIAISLPLSVFTTSMFQLTLVINWLLEARFSEKWEKAKSNRALQVLLCLFLINVVGLLWSENLTYAIKDLKIKLPLLSIPIIFATSVELTKHKVHRIMLFFTLGVFAASIASVMKLVGLLPGEVEGYRDLSLFMSHIRFSHMIVVALLIMVYFVFLLRNTISRAERLFYLGGLIWFPVFMVLLKSLSGIIIACFLALFILFRAVFEIRDQAIRFMVMVPVIMIPLFTVIYLGQSINKFYNFDELNPDELDAYTIEGNAYKNYPNLSEVENGHFIWIYICDVELEREWNRVSGLNFQGSTTNGNSLRGTLIRFLTSKGYRKDATGVKKLSSDEINAIEIGMANHIYMKRFRLYPRIYEVIWEFDRYKAELDPNEKSVVQRFLYMEAGWNIALKHPWFGVGNGDVCKAFEDYYNETNSPLQQKWRLRAHNQLLTFLISFGFPGLIICLVALIAPIFLANRHRSFMAAGILILALLSMTNEDTLEMSLGVTLIIFFYSLFLFGPDFPWLRRKLFKSNE